MLALSTVSAIGASSSSDVCRIRVYEGWHPRASDRKSS
jgi:hypothetical protein